MFTSKHDRKQCPILLRRVGYRDSETKKHYVFLTNNFRLAPKTMADIFRARWQVELFFRWIKQNLRIRSFLGTSHNAVLTQIWIAMCVHLILPYVKLGSRRDPAPPATQSLRTANAQRPVTARERLAT